MEWVIPDRTVQSSGACLQSIVDAFGELRHAVSRLFNEAGVGVLGRDGVLRIDPQAWYPIEIELTVLKTMRDRVGEATLYSVGVAIPSAIALPPQVTDVDSALAMLDVAYHLNHGRDGKPLFDVATGAMSEGIGHFAYTFTDKMRATVTAPGPFPCEMNRGIVTGLVRRFAPRASITLDTTRPSLSRGGPTSTYLVAW